MVIERPASERFFFLDALRGLGAVLVMVYHYSVFLQLGLAPLGFAFVDFFFVLSGFVLAHAYGDRLSRDMTLGAFAGQRFVRLYPMFFLGLAIGTVLLVLRSRAGFIDLSPLQVAASVLVNLFTLPFFHAADQTVFGLNFTGELFPGNSPNWSLFFELVANLMFFWLMQIRLRLVAMTVLAAYLLLVIRVHGGFGVGGWGSENVFAGLPRVTFSFFAGVLLYRLYRLDGFATVKRQGARWSVPAMLAVTLACILIAQLAAADLRISYVAAISIFPVLVLAGAMVTVPGGLVRPFALLGSLSYPLYCLHYPVGLGMDYLVRQGMIDLPPAGLFATATGITLLISVLALRFYDRPSRAALGALLGRVSRRASA